MSATASLQNLAARPKALSHSTHAGLLLQRKCACGSPTSSLTGECAECKSKKVLQTKLTIGASNDPLEQEADRVADQVMAKPSQLDVGGAPLHIQRFTGQAAGQANTAPASVDGVLASPGRPLDSTLQQDMGQRFGHDFSKVRVHSDAAAATSAHHIDAHAYTAGSDIVFGTGRFAPGTNEGRRLLAHELTHVLQQAGRTSAIQRAPATDTRWTRDVQAARYRGQLMAKRIKTHTKLSQEAGAKINTELAYFEGAAKDAYLKEVRPALLAVTEIEMPATHMASRRPPVGSLSSLIDDPLACGGSKCVSDDDIYAPLKEAKERDKTEMARRKESQLQELRAKTEAWTEDEAFMRRLGEKTTSAWKEDQAFAVKLLDEVLQQNLAPDPRGVSDAIRTPILQRYEAWLRSVDKASFDKEKGPYAHGPSELLDLEGALRRDRNVSDTAVNKVYWEVLEYRKKTDPYWLWTREYAGAMVSAGVAVVSAVQPADSSRRPAPRTPVNEPAPAPAAASTPAPARPSARTIKASPPPPPVRTSTTRGPAPVTDAEVMASNVRDPSSIKPQDPNRHQAKWQEFGGSETETAPLAYRDPDGNIRVSTDHKLLAPARRVGIPPVSPGAPTPVAPPARPAPKPAPTPTKRDIGTADTGQAPAVSSATPDPLAKTPAAPAPAIPARQPSTPNPKPGPQTGLGSKQSKQPMAPPPRGGARWNPKDPPQAISPDVVKRLGPRARFTVDHTHHQQAWDLLGGQGKAPPAFFSEGNGYLDPSRWPPKTK